MLNPSALEVDQRCSASLAVAFEGPHEDSILIVGDAVFDIHFDFEKSEKYCDQ